MYTDELLLKARKTATETCVPDLAAILLLAARVLHVYRERPITASITTMAILPNYDGSGAGVTWQHPIITHYYPSNQWWSAPICFL